MEYVLPFGVANAKLFEDCAIKIGLDRFIIRKFIYINQESDIDIFMLMGDERISLLLYAWKLCDKYIQNNDNKIDIAVETIHKKLLHYTLHIWFSREWQYSSHLRKAALLYCLGKAKVYLKTYNEMHEINWSYLLDLNMYPWANTYIAKLLTSASINRSCVDVIEDFETNPTVEDIKFLTQEGLAIIILRLVQLFNMNYMPAVLKLAIRTIIAWNALKAKKNQNVLTLTDTKYLQFICHLYIMAVYATDSTDGLIVDHLLYNIRFYYKSIMSKPLVENKKNVNFTAARHIALTCCFLQVTLDTFFQSIVINSYDECTTTLFGAITQCYRSYVLGNLLMELNALNDEDFLKHYQQYKRLVELYVDIRERSESYVLNEIRKLEKQSTSHNKTNTVDMGVDWKSMICKGNRFLKCEEEVKQHKEESDLDHRIDPVFQNMPKNLEILDYSYKALAGRQYNGWHFAKLVLLLKIISLKLNRLESWHYHMGLTIDFIINLELSIAGHFEDLAKIFHDHPFIEQELWLTAFYLAPRQYYFDAVTRCGLRFKRLNNPKLPEAKVERGPLNFLNAKCGLLSSTVDIRGIYHMSSHDAPNEDYIPLTKALQAIQLPEALIKDLLIVTFVPRHRHFSWAIQWSELRRRCKDFLVNNNLKRRCVELNMAEANNRLKFLKVDYQKYQHRPQLDYGSIEEGYEYPTGYGGDYDTDSDDEEEDDEDYNESPEPPKKKKAQAHVLPPIADSIFANTRRTRARVAAVIEAHAGGNLVDSDDEISQDVDAIEKKYAEQELSLKSSTPPVKVMPEDNNPDADVAKPVEVKLYSNHTEGFNKFRDIWNKSQIEIYQHQTEPATDAEMVASSPLLPGQIEYQKGRLKGFDELVALQANTSNASSNEFVDNEPLSDGQCELDLFDIDESPVSSIEYPIVEVAEDSDATAAQADKSPNANQRAEITNIELTTREGSPALTELDFNSFISINSEDQDPDSDRSDYSTTARRDSEEVDEPPSSPTAATQESFSDKLKNKETNDSKCHNVSEIDLFEEAGLAAYRKLNESIKEIQNIDASTAISMEKEAKNATLCVETVKPQEYKPKPASPTVISSDIQIAKNVLGDMKVGLQQSSANSTENIIPAIFVGASEKSDKVASESTIANQMKVDKQDEDNKDIVATIQNKPAEKNLEETQNKTKISTYSAQNNKTKATENSTGVQESKQTVVRAPVKDLSSQELLEKLKEKIALREVRVRIKRSPSELSALQITMESKTPSAEQSTTAKINKTVAVRPTTTTTAEEQKVCAKEKVIQKLHTPALHTKHNANLTSAVKVRISVESSSESSGSKKLASIDEDPESVEILGQDKDSDTEYTDIIEEYITIEPMVDDNYEEAILPDDNETMENKLKLECMQRRAYVRVEPLQTSDLLKLRQPKVLIKRIKSWTQQACNLYAAKSRTISTSSSNVSIMRQMKRKLSCGLSLSEEPQTKRSCIPHYARTVSTDSSSNSPAPSGRRKNLMVTPRSASGLKLRISSVGQEYGEQPLTSSSASSTPPYRSNKLTYNRTKRKKPMPKLIELSDDNEYNTDDDVVVVDETEYIPEDSTKHPLYEEEINI